MSYSGDSKNDDYLSTKANMLPKTFMSSAEMLKYSLSRLVGL